MVWNRCHRVSFVINWVIVFLFITVVRDKYGSLEGFICFKVYSVW